ncbi:transglycosylase domain-containing protein, partial [Deinococcus pimensis]|uniref:transglycosylase domain-containing protein n=1 Tax=Deinococcus pimensis TaxID=309888 RepID=UPI000A01328B
MNVVWRVLVLLVALAVAVAVGVAGVVATYAVKWTSNVPDYRQLDSLTLGSTTRVFARDLTQLGTLVPSVGGTRVNRTIVKLDDVSPYMLAAIVTNEDRRFFEHYGVDPVGVTRGLLKTLRNERVEGGSTLTNQLVKLTLLGDLEGARTPERKVKEWLLSVQLERAFTKEEILQNYLNVIYWGDGGPVELYGLHAAARAYLGKAPRDLTLAESVYLTTLVPAPGLRYKRYAEYRPVMKSLLNRMVEDGWVTRAQADAAWREKLQPRGWRVKYDDRGDVVSAKLVDVTETYLRAVTNSRAPHFMQQVERELIARFGRERVYNSGGLNVYTTLDPQAQSSAEKASREAKVPPGATLGAVLVDPYTGDVLAMIGQKIEPGRPLPDWNNAAQGQRQVGSSIKPLLYTTALSTGLSELHTERDEPTSFPCSSCEGGAYKPQNFGGKYYYRDMTLREALDRSLNIPTLKLADRIGLPTFRGKLRDLDLEPPKDSGLSLAIGTLEATPLKMAAAYAPFVNGGTYYPPRYITRVTTAAGKVLYDASQERPQKRRVWSPQVAYLGLDMIMGVVNDLEANQGGLATRARIPGWQVGGKTGTTNSVKDLWFVGVTPMYVGAVWVGKQQSGSMGETDFSGVVNPPIWNTMMSGALAGKPPRQFAVPEGIMQDVGPFGKEVAVLDPTYRAAADTEVEREDTETPRPRETRGPSEDPDTVEVTLDRRNGRLATEFTPPDAIVTRRVRLEDLPGYAPPANPEPLPEELPETPAGGADTNDKKASARGAQDGIPQAP